MPLNGNHGHDAARQDPFDFSPWADIFQLHFPLPGRNRRSLKAPVGCMSRRRVRALRERSPRVCEELPCIYSKRWGMETSTSENRQFFLV